jgi:hypothetical protein
VVHAEAWVDHLERTLVQGSLLALLTLGEDTKALRSCDIKAFCQVLFESRNAYRRILAKNRSERAHCAGGH